VGEPVDIKVSTKYLTIIAKRRIKSLCDPHSSKNAIFVAQQSEAVIIIYLSLCFSAKIKCGAVIIIR